VTVQHPHAELSAYVDDALDPAARAAVDGHLVACAVCRAHVAQLRATAVLLRALPDPVPSRPLVPRLAVPAWLAPLRTLMTLASGAAVFFFIATSLVSNITFLAGGAATTASREATGDAAVNAQAPAAQATAAPETGKISGASAAPAPVPSPEEFRAFSLTVLQSVDSRGAPGAATPDDARKRLERATAEPPALGGANATDTALAARSSRPQSTPLLNPWLWLTLAIVCGAIAIALHRRLRAAV
jgi:hypothetical protein